VSWPLAAYGLLALALAVGFAWYERSRPDARIVALVGTLAAFAALGRIAFAAVPNVKPTSDIVLIAGFALGAGPGFAVGAIGGLASNFFFGQGPWTPWQMAAWGATGVLGALLARGCSVRGRRSEGLGVSIGRWPLALVCAGAGFAFTAVQDVGDWITYSSHSVAALGAYVGSGLGFDGIYAAACFGFALALGPALLRSVQRLARRIEVTWVDVGGSGTHVAGVMIAAVLVSGALLGPGSGRARAAGSSMTPVARAVTYLERAQNGDGGLGEAPDEPSASLFTGWAALGLRSAGVDVATLHRGDGATLLSYIRGGEGVRDPGSLERTILVLRAAGVSATAPRDLVTELAHDVTADGSVSGLANLTAFGVLALRAVGGRANTVIESRALRWLAGQADSDGGFGFAGRGSGSDADDTGAVLEAFGSSRADDVVRARRRAVTYLRRDQDADGGFPNAPGAGSNAQSTAWAVQGLLAAGVAPATLRRGGHTPLGYLSGLVSGDGAVSYARGATQTPVWVTGEALMALTGTPLPVAPSPRRSATARPRGATATETTTSASTTAGASLTTKSTERRPPRPHPSHRPSRSHRAARPDHPSRPLARTIARMEAAVSLIPRRVIAAARLAP
jgi:energy-coupling factor transport system substrate-specific component